MAANAGEHSFNKRNRVYRVALVCVSNAWERMKTMPFTSKAQARFMFTKHPGIAKEFEAKTRSIKTLPERVGKKKKRNFGSFASGKPFGKG